MTIFLTGKNERELLSEILFPSLREIQDLVKRV